MLIAGGILGMLAALKSLIFGGTGELRPIVGFMILGSAGLVVLLIGIWLAKKGFE